MTSRFFLVGSLLFVLLSSVVVGQQLGDDFTDDTRWVLEGGTDYTIEGGKANANKLVNPAGPPNLTMYKDFNASPITEFNINFSFKVNFTGGDTETLIGFSMTPGRMAFNTAACDNTGLRNCTYLVLNQNGAFQENIKFVHRNSTTSTTETVTQTGLVQNQVYYVLWNYTGEKMSLNVYDDAQLTTQSFQEVNITGVVANYNFMQILTNSEQGTAETTSAELEEIVNIGFPATTPQFSTVVNNATSDTGNGDDVNWTTNISIGTGDLSFCWFTSNMSGSFANESVQSCSSPFVFDQTVTVNQSIGVIVCGFFGANNTGGEESRTSNSCFTVAESIPPTFNGSQNNASIQVINEVVQFSINWSDNFGLGYWVFGSNTSGSFVNNTATNLLGVEDVELFANESVDILPDKRICGRWYVNDSFGNENVTENCFTTSSKVRVNFTITNRSVSLLNFYPTFTVTMNATAGVINHTGSTTTGSVLFDINSGHDWTINISSEGALGRTEFVRVISGPSNITVNMPNAFVWDRPVDGLESEHFLFSLGVNGSDDGQYDEVKLVYNGTSYDTVRTNTGFTVWYNTTIPIPSIPSMTESRVFYWNFTVNGFNSRTEDFDFVTNAVELSLCNATGGNIANLTLNFSVFDEQNPTGDTNRLNALVDAEFFLYVTNRIGQINTSFDLNQNASSYAFCLFPNNQTVITDASIHYTTNPGFTHKYFLTNATLTNDTNFINAFNFKTQEAISDLKLTLRSVNDFSELSNLIAKLQRHYIGEATWRTVQMDRSGDFGLVFFNVEEEDVEYRIIYQDTNNRVLKQSDTLKFVCDPDTAVCELTQLLTPVGGTSPLRSDNVQAVFDNTTGVLTVSWIDPTGITSGVEMRVTKETLSGTTFICNAIGTGSAGSISCDTSGFVGPYFLQVYSSASPPVATFTQTFGEAVDEIAIRLGHQESALLTTLITMTAGVAAFASGVIGAVVIIPAMMVVMWLLGALSFTSFSTVVVLGLAGMLIAHKIKGNTL